MNTILFGNGLNRVNGNDNSWDDLLKNIANVELDKGMPNTMKYEYIIASNPYKEEGPIFMTSDGCMIQIRDGNILRCAGEIIEDKLKKDIARRVAAFTSNFVYQELSKIKVSHFLTTNYDTVLWKFLGKPSLDQAYKTEKLYNIRRHYKFPKNGAKYWPIHGICEDSKSIMLGLDHYCGSIGKIDDYIKGKYELHTEENFDDLENRLQKGISEEDIVSWIDLFFISDIHIIGFAFSFDETDLWWLLNRRKRIQNKLSELINNHIYYYSADETMPLDKKQLFEGFGVEIVTLDDYSVNYVGRYLQQIKMINKYVVAKDIEVI